jgi:hypothetical protein
LDPSESGGVDLLVRAVEGDVETLLSALTDALWRASDVKRTRAGIVDALLRLAAEPERPDRLSLLLGARGFDAESEVVGQALLEIVEGAPELAWTQDALHRLVTTTLPSSVQVLARIAGAASDPAVAAAAQRLVLEAPWHKEVEAARRSALVELWTARPDLADATVLRELLQRSEPRSVALLQACASGSSEDARGGAADLLYATEWRGTAQESFVEHLLQSPAPVPWTVELVERLQPGRFLRGESVQLLARAVREGDAAAAEHARTRLAEGLWSADLSTDPEAVDALLELVRSGSGPAARTARRILSGGRWRGEAQVRLDAVASELGLRRRSNSDRIERLRRRLEQEGLR